jgi:di/tricarboxylate transporter
MAKRFAKGNSAKSTTPQSSPSPATDRHRNSRDFFLVSRLENSQPPQHEKALIALLILAGLVVVVATELLPVLNAALIAAALMLLFRCTSITEARRSIDWEVLLAIAASFAIGKALEKTGAADAIGGGMIGLAQGEAWPTLAVVYLATLLATEIITNNAAAALMFPLAMSTAAKLNVSPMPFVIVVMMAASAGFATPIGYQTNLMVYGPGGYKFGDYVRLGVPLDILIWIVTIALTPIFFPF